MITLTSKIAAAVLIAGTAALTAAAPAGADAETLNEIAYIRALNAEGIPYSNEDAALTVGYGTCVALDAGATIDMVIDAGVDGADGFYSAYDVGYITGAALAAFCPEHLPAELR